MKNILDQLTPDQKQQIDDQIKELIQANATPEQIHQAVQVLLTGFGVSTTGLKKESSNIQPAATDSLVTLPVNKIIAKTGNFPNPFNPETRISYTLTKPEQVSIQIFNINGQLLRTLVNGYQDTGNYCCTWNGTLETGEPAPSGLYFYRIDAGGEKLVRRMLLTK